MSDLHEHAEASFEQVREASGHVLDVGAFKSVRMEHLLQDLPQERTIGRLQNTPNNTLEHDSFHPETPALTALLYFHIYESTVTEYK